MYVTRTTFVPSTGKSQECRTFDVCSFAWSCDNLSQPSLPIPGVPEKAERWIFSTMRVKSIIFIYVIRSNIFRRRDDAKIIEFGWVVLIICPFLEIRSFSNFARCLRPMSGELCRE